MKDSAEEQNNALDPKSRTSTLHLEDTVWRDIEPMNMIDEIRRRLSLSNGQKSAKEMGCPMYKLLKKTKAGSKIRPWPITAVALRSRYTQEFRHFSLLQTLKLRSKVFRSKLYSKRHSVPLRNQSTTGWSEYALLSVVTSQEAEWCAPESRQTSNDLTTSARNFPQRPRTITQLAPASTSRLLSSVA